MEDERPSLRSQRHTIHYPQLDNQSFKITLTISIYALFTQMISLGPGPSLQYVYLTLPRVANDPPAQAILLYLIPL